MKLVSYVSLKCAVSLFVVLTSMQAFAARSLAVNPTSLTFGSVTVGTSAIQNVVMLNTGTANITVASAAISGAGFVVTGLVLPMTLAPGQSVAFQVVYAPSLVGTTTGTLYLRRANGMVLASVGLSGSGIAAALSLSTDLTPPAISVTSPSSGATLSGTVTLSASASDNVGVTRVQFYVNGTAIGSQLTAAPYSVSWTTTGVSNGSGYVIAAVAWDAAGNQTTSTGVSATVSNVAPVQHSAALTWQPSASSVLGYYVYRATQNGGPYARVTSSPSAATLYTDMAVYGGQTYYYVVTAVDANGVESGYSNQTVAQIPQ